MKPLPILWQRLVSQGKTCDRCHATHHELTSAIEKLTRSLAPLGIEPKLEIRALDEQTFRANPSQSNRIWIAGKPMEEWVGASVGSSQCCSVCGTSECRTVEVAGVTFETVPEELFLRAAMRAVSELIGSEKFAEPTEETSESGCGCNSNKACAPTGVTRIEEAR